jgi:hypothetical protein
MRVKFRGLKDAMSWVLLGDRKKVAMGLQGCE